ncbi:hypothetical protein [Mucilaginibacter aquariorum]|uniref:Uncharacterized protein n=1 Tax=Mucilaginibacter aquariorum TaxID=2967225 RepID=A0ABT1SYD2_9SPHI|nr:hypothetical protein [Mucilaginibacter aquariorum]MCQ6957356.1 hypothetical protein [Mucilaginibacter aquariorum]
MENKPEGFDRANGQGQNHDIIGNVANVGNDMLKKDVDDKDLAKKVPTVTPETIPNDNPELETPTDQTSSNKGQGPAGENL